MMTLMHSRTALVAALAIGIGATAPALADTIRCESQNGRERFCAANTRGGVTLSSQLSRDGCYQGETWGYDRRGIWVSGGCRAEFWTGGYQGNNYYSGNDYYSDRNRGSSNDGAKVAVALGAILGAAVIASAANKNKNNGGNQYQTYFDRGCNAAKSDRRANQGNYYGRHGGSYDDRNEQAFASGYNQCWSSNR
jgi:hypothetical protein